MPCFTELGKGDLPKTRGRQTAPPCRERIGGFSFSVFGRQVETSLLHPFCPGEALSRGVYRRDVAPLSEPRETGHQARGRGHLSNISPLRLDRASGPLLMAALMLPAGSLQPFSLSLTHHHPLHSLASSLTQRRLQGPLLQATSGSSLPLLCPPSKAWSQAALLSTCTQAAEHGHRKIIQQRELSPLHIHVHSCLTGVDCSPAIPTSPACLCSSLPPFLRETVLFLLISLQNTYTLLPIFSANVSFFNEKMEATNQGLPTTSTPPSGPPPPTFSLLLWLNCPYFQKKTNPSTCAHPSYLLKVLAPEFTFS